MDKEHSDNLETPPRAARKSNFWRRLLFAFACAVTLVVLAYAEENWRGRHAWQKQRRQWEAKGEKFTIAALVPPPVPDEQNFALAPILKPIFDLSHGPNGVVWRDTNGWARLSRFSDALAPDHATNLALASLEKGTFADIADWAKAYRGSTNFPAAAPNATPAEVVLAALSKLDPDFRELKEAAASRPYSRFPVPYQEQPPWGILLPHLARLKQPAVLAQVKATAELEAGRPAEALDDLKLGLRISGSIRDEPLMISHLVRVVTLGAGLQTVREALLRHAWTDAQLAQVQEALASVNLMAEYKTFVRGDQALMVEELDYLRRHGEWGEDVSPFFGQGITTCGRVLRFAPSGWIYQNMLAFCRQYEEFNLPAVDDRERRLFPEKIEAGARVLDQCRGPYTLFVKAILPGWQRVIQRSGRMQTFVDAARVACALDRYRLANGSLPDNLAALTPRFLERIPADIIDGQPLRWRRDAGGGYALYSVGWNQTDDGGVPGWNQNEDTGVFGGLLKEKAGAWVDPAKGDWVWEMPPK